MDLKIILGIIFLSILVFIIGVFLPSGNQHVEQQLPWQIEHTPEGSTRVFGLTLGKTTLRETEEQLRDVAEVSLFATDLDTKAEEHIVEAYFDKVKLGGFSARVVVELDIAPMQLKEMYARGKRISTLGSGASKVTLHKADRDAVFNEPIASIAYLPRIALDDKLIKRRFGHPAEKIWEEEGKTIHWLYPDIGLDIARDADNHAVFQYVHPQQFARLRDPLMENNP